MKKIYTLTIFLLILATNELSAQTSTPANSANLQEATKLHAQVIQLYKERRFNEALPLAKKVVELREKELKDDDHSLAVVYLNLAYIHRARQTYYEAEKYFRKALKVEEKRLGKEHPDLYDILVNIGWMCHGIGDASNAEEMFRRAISNTEKQVGAEHKDVADALSNLAAFYQKVGQAQKALPVIERMLTIVEKANGEASKKTQEIVEQYACALGQNKKEKEADEQWKRSRDIEQKLNPQVGSLTGQVLQGKALFRAEPAYPQAAKNARLQGTVLIKVLIDESGNVLEAKRLCGPDLLASESEEAARRWKFTPTELNGQPTKVQGILTFHFTLQ